MRRLPKLIVERRNPTITNEEQYDALLNPASTVGSRLTRISISGNPPVFNVALRQMKRCTVYTKNVLV
jgi:hypothetical protein